MADAAGSVLSRSFDVATARVTRSEQVGLPRSVGIRARPLHRTGRIGRILHRGRLATTTQYAALSWGNTARSRILWWPVRRRDGQTGGRHERTGTAAGADPAEPRRGRRRRGDAVERPPRRGEHRRLDLAGAGLAQCRGRAGEGRPGGDDVVDHQHPPAVEPTAARGGGRDGAGRGRPSARPRPRSGPAAGPSRATAGRSSAAATPAAILRAWSRGRPLDRPAAIQVTRSAPAPAAPSAAPRRRPRTVRAAGCAPSLPASTASRRAPPYPPSAQTTRSGAAASRHGPGAPGSGGRQAAQQGHASGRPHPRQTGGRSSPASSSSSDMAAG
jgi:hypothetical protein